MVQLTKEQFEAAHDAWEETASAWRIRKVSNYGMADDMWLLEPVASDTYDPSAKVSDEYTYHKFDGPDAKRKAQFMLRDKIVRAVAAAIINPVK
jgi:hypothetical protein